MEENKCHWSDLPNDDIELVLGYANPQTKELNKLLLAYHDLDKDDADLLQLRVDRLEDIIEHLEDWVISHLTPEVKVKHIVWLKECAEQKRNYLFQLLALVHEDMTVDDLREAYHHDARALEDNRFKPITLNKARYYSIKKGEHWGDFWWVTTDPCHRQLTNYLRVWEKTQNSHKVADFFLWLETQEVPKYQPIEDYMTPERASEFELVIEHGKLHHAQSKKVVNMNDFDKKYLFVLGLDLRLYVATETHSMFHSCFTSGKPVLCAGKLTIEHGQIKTISLESGHYIPGLKEGYDFLMLLKEQGYQYDAPIALSFFHDRNKYTSELSMNGKMDFETFKQGLEQQIKRCGENQ